MTNFISRETGFMEKETCPRNCLRDLDWNKDTLTLNEQSKMSFGFCFASKQKIIKDRFVEKS